MDALDVLVPPATGATTDPDDPQPHESSSLIERTGLVGSSTSMRRLRTQVARYARPSASVLITGETGTGKELVARALHVLSPRARRPFVAVNVAALGESVLMSELFGHERGAFTGASMRHRGLFEQAHGGTLFLDEVGELAPAAQAALLRVLETREVRAVGAERTHPVNVRVVAATHRNLRDLIRRGTFRPDLYYRLATLVLRVPTLSERLDDLPELVRHLLAQLAPEVGARTFDPSFIAGLGAHDWPGGVRELQNIARRIVIETDARLLTGAHLRAALTHEGGGHREPDDLAPAEDLAQVLADERWNLTQTARRLGIARSTVRARIRRAGLVRDG